MGGLEDVAVSVHPGLIDTSLIHNWIQRGDVLGRLLVPIVNLIMRPLSKWILLPAEFGVRTVMYAATAPPQQVRKLVHRKVGLTFGRCLGVSCCELVHKPQSRLESFITLCYPLVVHSFSDLW